MDNKLINSTLTGESSNPDTVTYSESVLMLIHPESTNHPIVLDEGFIRMPSVWPGVVDEVPQEFNRDIRGFYCDAVASEALSVWRETINEIPDGLTLNREPGFGTATHIARVHCMRNT